MHVARIQQDGNECTKRELRCIARFLSNRDVLAVPELRYRVSPDVCSVNPRHRLSGLAVVNSMAPASAKSKAIVIPVAFSEEDGKAVRFAVDSLYRSGDSIHLVHVLRTREPGNEIYHGVHVPPARHSKQQSLLILRPSGIQQRGLNGSSVQVLLEHRLTSMTHWKGALKNRKLHGHGKKFKIGMWLDQRSPCLASSIW